MQSLRVGKTHPVIASGKLEMHSATIGFIFTDPTAQGLINSTPVDFSENFPLGKTHFDLDLV